MLSRYHWGLIVGPKEEKEDGRGMRYHVMQKVVGPNQMPWIYEARDIHLLTTNMLLVRVVMPR